MKQDQYLRTVWDRVPEPPPKGPKGADRITILRDGFDPPESADIRPLSDEFSTMATLGNWHRLWREEYWQRDPVEQLDIGVTLAGWMTFVPYTSTWYEDYVGELAFQPVSGDFVATTRHFRNAIAS